MKDDLTREERWLLAQIEAAGKWDPVISDVSILVPSFIIIGFGLRFDSPSAVITGMAIYAALTLRTSLHQAKYTPIMKSLIEKLKQQDGDSRQPPQAESPSCAKTPGHN